MPNTRLQKTPPYLHGPAVRGAFARAIEPPRPSPTNIGVLSSAIILPGCLNFVINEVEAIRKFGVILKVLVQDS